MSEIYPEEEMIETPPIKHNEELEACNAAFRKTCEELIKHATSEESPDLQSFINMIQTIFVTGWANGIHFEKQRSRK